MNIILVSDASARARTITLNWPHWVGGSVALFTLFVMFALLFNYVALRWATADSAPWLSAIVLSDRREEAQRMEELVQGRLTAMAIRLGELQARIIRLDGIGARLATIAGVKPQEPSTPPLRNALGVGGAGVTQPSHVFSIDEFTALVEGLTSEVQARSDQLGFLETVLVRDSANRQFLPTRSPVADALFSSNFGYRIDPFTGHNTFHEGLDIPAEAGTPILAAASGKVVKVERHAEYGKWVEIDHGNGLTTRYAHASLLFVKSGDLVVAGQRIGGVGSSGRSTGPHLHFEIRLHGIAQNPIRFLENARGRYTLAAR